MLMTPLGAAIFARKRLSPVEFLLDHKNNKRAATATEMVVAGNISRRCFEDVDDSEQGGIQLLVA